MVGGDCGGGAGFVKKVQVDLGMKAKHREVHKTDGASALREPREDYVRDPGVESEVLRPDDTLVWDKSTNSAET
jgi:hypothetical protein